MGSVYVTKLLGKLQKPHWLMLTSECMATFFVCQLFYVNDYWLIFYCSRRLAVPVNSLSKMLVRVDVSSGYYICEMPNTCEKD